MKKKKYIKDIYLKKKDFEIDFQAYKDSEATFERHYTNYTETLKLPNYTIRYNEHGEQDKELLHIINLVKNDARKYLKNNNVKTKHDIAWTELKEVPYEKNCYKIDINSAYWEVAKSKGIISEKTNLTALKYAERLKPFLNETKEEYEARRKSRFKFLRTRSIGALATKKKIEYYQNGEHIPELDKSNVTGELSIEANKMRNLYLDICEHIDVVMQLILRSVPDCIFYYWDCAFVFPNGLEQALEILHKEGFEATEDYNSLEVIPISDYRLILETKEEGKKAKQYNVKPMNCPVCNGEGCLNCDNLGIIKFKY